MPQHKPSFTPFLSPRLRQTIKSLQELGAVWWASTIDAAPLLRIGAIAPVPEVFRAAYCQTAEECWANYAMLAIQHKDYWTARYSCHRAANEQTPIEGHGCYCLTAMQEQYTETLARASARLHFDREMDAHFEDYDPNP